MTESARGGTRFVIIIFFHNLLKITKENGQLKMQRNIKDKQVQKKR